ncbi:hypothetical protein SEA_SHROOMS_35 [Arthrobacter phage Shrooms]|nr:hypothetical protein SEA_SHROOMS_35 [Arthrobacter phage Shrooms]
MLYRIARWWYSPILCGALGSASSLTLRKIGHPVSPSFATALLVVVVCAAIALLLIALVHRTFKARSARLKAVAANLARAEQRARDKVAARYPKPSAADARQLRDDMQAIADAVSQHQRTSPVVPTRSYSPNPVLNNTTVRATPRPNRGTRPTRNVGYRPAVLTSDTARPYGYGVDPVDYSDRDRQSREREALADAAVSAVVAATTMDAIMSTQSYSAPEPSYSAPDTSSWSSPSSSYDGGSSSSFDSGSFGGGDSGSF